MYQDWFLHFADVEGMGGEVLYQVGVELEAVPVVREDFCQAGERGEGREEGDGEGGSGRWGVLAREMAAAKP